jgi:predicted CXXCH cytochrome family protein
MSPRGLTLVMALALALAACASVLGIRPTSQAHTFEHRAHVSKGVNCKTCHAGIQDAGDEGPLHLPSAQTCLGCHQKPHDARDCGTCHGEAHVRGGAELARRHLRFEHKKHLALGTVNGDCVRCHDDVGLEKPETLRPKMAQCFSCHAHEKQWSVRDCDGCHVDLENENTLPATHLVHEGDWIREHGARAASARDLCAACHSERSCASCHGVGTVPALPARLAFDEVRLSGLHRAGFRARHADEARADPGLCTTCHSEQSCSECHAKKNVAPGAAPRSPHPQGWVGIGRGGGDHGVQARLDPASCASCHGGAGEQLCVGCHRVGGPGGSPHGRGFSSKKDKLRDVPCRQCHGASP